MPRHDGDSSAAAADVATAAGRPPTCQRRAGNKKLRWTAARAAQQQSRGKTTTKSGPKATFWGGWVGEGVQTWTGHTYAHETMGVYTHTQIHPLHQAGIRRGDTGAQRKTEKTLSRRVHVHARLCALGRAWRQRWDEGDARRAPLLRYKHALLVRVSSASRARKSGVGQGLGRCRDEVGSHAAMRMLMRRRKKTQT